MADCGGLAEAPARFFLNFSFVGSASQDREKDHWLLSSGSDPMVNVIFLVISAGSSIVNSAVAGVNRSPGVYKEQLKMFSKISKVKS